MSLFSTQNLAPPLTHSGGFLANCIIQSADDSQVPVFHKDKGAWQNEYSTSLDVEVKLTKDQTADGTIISGLQSIQGNGSTEDPLFFKWSTLTQPGDMIYNGLDDSGPAAVSTGGAGSKGKVLTVNTLGIPSWQLLPSEQYSAYVFPDAAHQTVTVPFNSTWTAMNGTNDAKPYPYATGGLIDPDTLKFTAPFDGTYRLIASFQLVGGSFTGQFGAGFDYNGGANAYPTNGGQCVQVSVGNTVYFGEMIWERPFKAGDTAQFYMLIQSGSIGSATCLTNFMSAVKT